MLTIISCLPRSSFISCHLIPVMLWSGFQRKVQNPLLASKGEVNHLLMSGASSLVVWNQAGAETVTWVLATGCPPPRRPWPLVQHIFIPLFLVLHYRTCQTVICLLLRWETLYRKSFLKRQWNVFKWQRVVCDFNQIRLHLVQAKGIYI